MGENIYSSWASSSSSSSSANKMESKASDPVESWYGEVEKYNYETEAG